MRVPNRPELSATQGCLSSENTRYVRSGEVVETDWTSSIVVGSKLQQENLPSPCVVLLFPMVCVVFPTLDHPCTGRSGGMIFVYGASRAAASFCNRWPMAGETLSGSSSSDWSGAAALRLLPRPCRDFEGPRLYCAKLFHTSAWPTLAVSILRFVGRSRRIFQNPVTIALLPTVPRKDGFERVRTFHLLRDHVA